MLLASTICSPQKRAESEKAGFFPVFQRLLVFESSINQIDIFKQFYTLKASKSVDRRLLATQNYFTNQFEALKS